MTIVLDASGQLRSIYELANLVHAISSAPLSESEPGWLEWKREADLSDRRWHALIAKCIAGFANRDPVVANQWAGGCSYLVVGAEPGEVRGVTPVDNADLHAGISRFVRDTVRWNPQYIPHEGTQVLIVTVEPPDNGDQIVAMLTDFQSHDGNAKVCRKGEVFIRRHGKTDIAGQEDYDMLVRRSAASVGQASDIGVQYIGALTAVSISCGSDVEDSCRGRLERELLAPLERGRHDPVDTPRLLNFDNRGPDEYRQQVTSYISEVVSLLPDVTRAAALKIRAPSMQLTVVNHSEHNIANVRLEVAILGDVCGYRSFEDAQPKMPSPPRKLGSAPWINLPNFDATTAVPNLAPWEPQIDNSGSTSIEFPDVDLRPYEHLNLDPIYLICDATLAGATLTAKWKATSSSVSGQVRGEFPIEVSAEVFSLTIE